MQKQKVNNIHESKIKPKAKLNHKLSQKIKWLPFEHEILRLLKAEGLLARVQKKKILVAVSGGADSVALLMFLSRLNPILKNELHVIHIHHGKKGNLKFRNSAQKLSQKLAKKLQVPFHIFYGEVVGGESENAFRKIRLAAYKQLKSELNYDILVTGHHRDDLLETRLLRLIRGTGLVGLTAMEIFSGEIFRPFLTSSKQSLMSYLKDLNQDWTDDPSNLDPKFLRNWMRLNWLPDLEARSPGSTKSLERSLQNILERPVVPLALKKGKPGKLAQYKAGIKRNLFNTSSPAQQRKILIDYYKEIGLNDLRHTQIEEVRRQLDNRQIVHKFIVAGAEWKVNAQQIVATIV